MQIWDIEEQEILTNSLIRRMITQSCEYCPVASYCLQEGKQNIDFFKCGEQLLLTEGEE